MRLKFCKGDLLAVIFVAVLAVTVFVCFLPQKNASSAYAEIFLSGQRIKTVDLSVDQTFDVTDRYRNVIIVADGGISVAESDCPGQDCVHSGRISTSGRILVCLPNGLEIRIPAADADVDFVVG